MQDFPACDRLLQEDTPEAVAARTEYETLIKIHQVAAAVIAFEKKHHHFPKANAEGVSWRQQVAPFFQLEEIGRAHV